MAGVEALEKIQTLCPYRESKDDFSDMQSVLQGGSNMTGTDLCVNKPHCAAAVHLEIVKPQPPPSLLLGLEPVQSCLGVARVMSEQKVPRSVEQRIVIKSLVGENVPSAEIHHRLQQQYGEECLRRMSSPILFLSPL